MPEDDPGLLDVGGVALDEVAHEVGEELVVVGRDPRGRGVDLLEYVVVVLVHLLLVEPGWLHLVGKVV